jgi:hypothetical protein
MRIRFINTPFCNITEKEVACEGSAAFYLFENGILTAIPKEDVITTIDEAGDKPLPLIKFLTNKGSEILNVNMTKLDGALN